MKSETELKMRDAATQMKIAYDQSQDEIVFRSCINSFISMARSVTMIMEKESSKKPDVLLWYKNKMEVLGSELLFKFFNNQRVHTIHRGVVQPNKVKRQASKIDMNKSSKDGLYEGKVIIPAVNSTVPFEEGDIVGALEDGTVWGWYFTEHKKYLPEHSGSVFALCDAYYLELRKLFDEWQIQG